MGKRGRLCGGGEEITMPPPTGAFARKKGNIQLPKGKISLPPGEREKEKGQKHRGKQVSLSV